MIDDKRTINYVGLLVSILPAAVFVWGIVEAGYGLMQVLGWRASGHMLYGMTGHFRNPGPYGGFIACVMAVAGAWLLGSPVRPGMTDMNPGKTGTAYARLGLRYLAWGA
ncbi:MAG: hypothetical protein J6W98_00435, partial [Bacteroidales bacterium]|nr:hypothetical protein [Bacteroidales bacterium]